MPNRSILTYPQYEQLLRSKSKEVRYVADKVVQEIIHDMVEIVVGNEIAAGLSAPQIGELLRIVVVQLSKDLEPMVLINPIITKKKGRETDYEGCLSIPDVFAPVTRATHIQIRALSTGGKGVRLDARNFFARVLQHEVDHLDGVLFIDRAEAGEVTTPGYKEKTSDQDVHKVRVA